MQGAIPCPCLPGVPFNAGRYYLPLFIFIFPSAVAEQVDAGEALDEAFGVVAESERASMPIYARCKSLPAPSRSQYLVLLEGCPPVRIVVV